MKIKIQILLVVCVLLAVYASQANADVNDHVLHIEMSTTYKFGTTSVTPIEYCFDAWMQVDDTVESGSVQPPAGDPCTAEFEDYEEGKWLGISLCSSDLNDLNDFTAGTYTFTVNYTGGGSDSTTVEYSLENGDPIPPVTEPLDANYPVNGAVGVPLAISFDLVPLSDPNWTYGIYYEPNDGDPNARSGEVTIQSYTTESVGPIILSSDVLYKVELNTGQAIWSKNDDEIPYVVDKDSERFLYFTTTSGEHLFIKHPDINYDGHVDFFDLDIMADNWLAGL
jgi:hypothetical protein